LKNAGSIQPNDDAEPEVTLSQGHWLAHILSLSALLAVLWLALSGHYTPLILFFGIVSVVLTVFISLRMDLLDFEGLPFHIAWRTTIFYWPWLIWEIVLANLDVIKRIISPKLDIDPTVFTTEASQNTDLGMIIYANSITLTPGTVSIDLDPGEIQVHALSKAGADGILSGEMDRRCSQSTGG